MCVGGGGGGCTGDGEVSALLLVCTGLEALADLHLGNFATPHMQSWVSQASSKFGRKMLHVEATHLFDSSVAV